MGLQIHSFELIVMLSVLRLGGDAYGVPIREEMERRLGGGAKVPVGSVYATLVRLQAKGWLKARLGEATAERGGRAKTYFEVTGRGLQEVRRSRQTLLNFWEGIPDLR